MFWHLVLLNPIIFVRLELIAPFNSNFCGTLEVVTSINEARKCDFSNSAKLGAYSAIYNGNNPVVKQVFV